MILESRSLADQKPVPPENAMGVPGEGGPQPGPNRSPHLKWSDFPPETQSFAVVCVDPDAPARADDANRTDRVIAYDFERADFYHWLLVDIPVTIAELAEGLDSKGVTPRGKAPGKTDHGTRGINSYKEWFGNDPEMGGDYGGYDGPWPPFNDERTHRYVFTVYAIGVPSLDLPSNFRATDALEAIRRSALDQASLTATYTLNPASR